MQMMDESTEDHTLRLSTVRKGKDKNFGSTNILEVEELWKMSTWKAQKMNQSSKENEESMTSLKKSDKCKKIQ